MVLFRTRTRPGRRAGRAAEGAATALDRRLPLMEAGRSLLRKAFPDHWSFLLGEIALYSFAILVLTGVFLTFFFHPSMTETVYRGAYTPLRGVRLSEAYASTLHISFDVRGGLLIRQVHHWAALLFLASIGVHLLRIFFTGAFRRPRELNWTIGVTLLLLALLEGFAGYSLPDDLLSGTGLRTAQGFVLAVPVAGTYLSFLLFGGEYPGHEIIPRLYAAHVLLLPGLLVALVTAHLVLVVRLKHTQWAARGATGRNVLGKPLFPQYAAKSAGFFFAVFGVLALLSAVAQVNPVFAYGPYRADQVSTDAQPDWYMGFLEGAIRLMPGAETRLWGHTVSWNPLLPAVVLPGVLFLLLYAYPFFERWVTGDTGEHHLADRPRNQPVRTGIGVAALSWYTVLLLAGGQDVLAYTLHVSVDALNRFLRVCFLVVPPAAFWLARRAALALQAHDRELLEEGEEAGFVRQEVQGAYEGSHRRIGADRAYVLMARRLPRPLPAPPGGAAAPRRARLRSALSAWYTGDRVEMPATDAQRRRIAALTAGPARGTGGADGVDDER
ncbi:cytochrome b N-terminal domain-containing protein [Streptacidiphilus sp. ASG 303]|uniref:cytochrome bc1 complex cytochrome b subunit n=1 Tax=Streptacidiphilus sp. ASG 303 TaxID=2896847 RepID=UPI001E64AEF1|nr:cytochrome b N-terminal domain-containing protein [Streptacidiphilus sp. ASG 303]MCD0485423.1 cytochrome b N-terminal domain-containing protein [Streptacidiphilus sp. ASG 303]